MSSEYAIKVENLSKCYQIYNSPRDRLKQFIVPRLKRALGRQSDNYFREFWALRDVSFEVKKGETVGIIGRNGSGKSTLLQLICGTLSSTSGSIKTQGRIAALLELGSGFNLEFSGRENVYMNGTLLGMTQDEIGQRFDAIVAFADIGDFLEQPVKTYSSGMFVRLAFAVNIMSNPEIMVVDEALAVGDMAFQAKCMTALKRLQDGGVTVLFVSHDVGSVKSLCQQAAYLDRGQVISFGKAAAVAEDYVRIMREEMNAQNSSSRCNSDCVTGKALPVLPAKIEVTNFKTSESFEHRVAQFRYGIGGARIDYAELLDLEGQPIVTAEFNQSVEVKIFFTTQIETELSVNYYIQDDKKNFIIGAGFRTAGEPMLYCRPNKRYIITYSTDLPLQEGNYSIQFQLTRPVVMDQAADFLDVIDDAIIFNVQRRHNGRIWTKVYLPNSVEIEKDV